MICSPQFNRSTLITSLLIAAAMLVAPQVACADPMFDLAAPGHWRLAVSPYSLHFSHNEDHRYVWAVGLERQADSDWLWGGSYFSNSFGQPSGYVYVGKRYPDFLGTPQLYAQWSAGLMYGYRGEFQHKVPLNYKGFSPGMLLSLGWSFNRDVSAQVNLLGNSGLMLQFSHDFH